LRSSWCLALAWGDVVRRRAGPSTFRRHGHSSRGRSEKNGRRLPSFTMRVTALPWEVGRPKRRRGRGFGTRLHHRRARLCSETNHHVIADETEGSSGDPAGQTTVEAPSTPKDPQARTAILRPGPLTRRRSRPCCSVRAGDLMVGETVNSPFFFSQFPTVIRETRSRRVLSAALGRESTHASGETLDTSSRPTPAINPGQAPAAAAQRQRAKLIGNQSGLAARRPGTSPSALNAETVQGGSPQASTSGGASSCERSVHGSGRAGGRCSGRHDGGQKVRRRGSWSEGSWPACRKATCCEGGQPGRCDRVFGRGACNVGLQGGGQGGGRPFHSAAVS